MKIKVNKKEYEKIKDKFSSQDIEEMRRRFSVTILLEKLASQVFGLPCDTNRNFLYKNYDTRKLFKIEK